jgi:hypothetical protein
MILSSEGMGSLLEQPEAFNAAADLDKCHRHHKHDRQDSPPAEPGRELCVAATEWHPQSPGLSDRRTHAPAVAP